MSGYPHAPSGYGYGPPPPGGKPYSSSSAPPPSGSQPYSSGSAPPYGYSYDQKPQGPPPPPGGQAYSSGSAPPPAGSQPYSTGSAPPYAYPYDQKPQPSAPPPPPPGGSGYPSPQQQYGSPFSALLPSQFPPGTDPSIITCFQMVDEDGSGFIDDKELQRALSSYNQSFSIRTVRLLMFMFTGSNSWKIGPKEFTALFYSLQNWRAIFQRFDRDSSGKIDSNELRQALLSLGYAVSPTVLEMLVSKFDRSGGRTKAIEYDNFIECCLLVKGLTEKFKEKDKKYSGSATFTYEEFMLTVLPFLIM